MPSPFPLRRTPRARLHAPNAPSHSPGQRVGIIPQGGRDWIAGTIYVQNLVRALELLPAEDRPLLRLLVGPGKKEDDYRSLFPQSPPSIFRYTHRSGESFRSKVRSTIRHRPTGWPTSLERLAADLDLSVLFPVPASLGHSFPCTWIGWIPDFQHKRMPEFFSSAESHRRDEHFRELVQEAPHLVVSSEDAYADLMQWFPASAPRASTLPFVSVGEPSWYQGAPNRVLARFSLPPKFLIFPSQFWMHKNHRRLFEAIRIARDSIPDVALVCTGRMYDYRHPNHGQELLEELTRQGLERQVYCLGLLERTAQIQLLRVAAAVIQPSLFEGWSSLVEDAQALGKTIYVSDIPVHREQDPPRAHFFDPTSPEELAGLIVRDWNAMVPGPDPVDEAEARQTQEQRAIDYAYRFLRVVDQART